MVCKKYDCILSNEIACFKSDLIKSMTVDFEIFPTVKQKHKKVMGWQIVFSRCFSHHEKKLNDVFGKELTIFVLIKSHETPEGIRERYP